MSEDIFIDVRKEILKEEKAKNLWAPKSLKQTWEVAVGIAGAAAGAIAGFSIGAHIGIVAGPLGGIAGSVPCAIIGGAIGYFGGAKVGSQFHKPTVQRADPALRGLYLSDPEDSTKLLHDATHCYSCGAEIPIVGAGGKSRCSRCGSY